MSQIRVQKSKADATQFIVDSIQSKDISFGYTTDISFGYKDTAQVVGNLIMTKLREMQEKNSRGLPVPVLIVSLEEE